MPATRTPAIEAIQRRYDREIKAVWTAYDRDRMTLDQARFEAETIRRAYLKLVERECPGQMLLAD